MKLSFFLLTFVLFTANSSLSQSDSVFITKTIYNENDSLVWVTDTAYFYSPLQRNILMGTCQLPWTYNQMSAKNYGLDFVEVKKSDCSSHGEEVYKSKDKINSYGLTDSTLTIDFTLYSNCCYDFLCDISVDKEGVLNLHYQGYGSYCACNCCFGLIYELEIYADEENREIKGIVLNGKQETFLKIE